jgi:hypothetical protein
MVKKHLSSDYKVGTLLKLHYANSGYNYEQYYLKHWIVEVQPDRFVGIATNVEGCRLPASTESLHGASVVRAEVIKRSDLLLCMDWTIGEDFERIMKGKKIKYED